VRRSREPDYLCYGDLSPTTRLYVTLERHLSIRARKNPATAQSSATVNQLSSQIANMAALPATSFAAPRERMNDTNVTISAAKMELRFA
jgi:hypothetical protein